MATPQMPVFRAPSAREASMYYFGFPGVPKLIARLGNREFRYEGQIRDNEQIDEKRIVRIGSHPLKECLDKVVDGTTQTLRDEILLSITDLGWSSVDFVRIDDGHDARVTILISIPSEKTLALGDIRSALESIWAACDRKGIHDQEIELIQLESRAAAWDYRGPPLPSYPYPRQPKCGSSLGVTQGTGVGTLGCYVWIDGPHEGTYILTNDHVAQSLARDVYCPATEDHSALETSLNETIENIRAACDDEEAQFARWSTDGIPISCAASRRFEARQQELRATTNALNEIVAANRHVGRVTFTSGSRADASGARMDWALIKPFGEENKSPAVGAKNEFDDPPSRFNNDLRRYASKGPGLFQPLASGLVSDLGSLAFLERALKSDADNLTVVKCGRSTAWTIGSINEIESECCREHDSLKTREVSVYSSPLSPFSDFGDSGSIVMDSDGRVAGLLHSLVKGQAAAVLTRITPICSVVEDIKSFTGATKVEFM